MLSRDMARYVDLRRSLGFRFRVQHSFLRNFVAFAEARGDDFVRIDRVLDWAARAPSPASCRIRLLTVRRFALAMQAEDIRYEVPAADARRACDLPTPEPTHLQGGGDHRTDAGRRPAKARRVDQAPHVRDAFRPPRGNWHADLGSLGAASRGRHDRWSDHTQHQIPQEPLASAP